MNKPRMLAAALMLVCTLAGAAPREEALAVVEQWRVAFNKADIDTLVALHAPDAIVMGTQSRRLITTPQGVRKYYASLKVQPYASQLDDLLALVAGNDAVVVTGIDRVEAHRGGQDFAFSGRVTFVLAKRGSVWQIVHYHRSPLPP